MLIQQYRILFDYLFYLDKSKWTVFSIFSVMNGVLISAFVNAVMNNSSIGMFLISLLGFIFCLAWFFINARNAMYFNHRKEKMDQLERKLKSKLNDKFMPLWLSQLPEPKHLWERVPARTMAAICIIFLVCFWLYLTILSKSFF